MSQQGEKLILRTTKAHFEYFKKRVRYWYKHYNLSGWWLYFDHCDIERNYARVRVNMVGRVATFMLSIEWFHPDVLPLNQHTLDDSARHEIIHLILGPMGNLVNARFVTQDEVTAAEETVVRHLEELL